MKSNAPLPGPFWRRPARPHQKGPTLLLPAAPGPSPPRPLRMPAAWGSVDFTAPESEKQGQKYGFYCLKNPYFWLGGGAGGPFFLPQGHHGRGLAHAVGAAHEVGVEFEGDVAVRVNGNQAFIALQLVVAQL